MTSVYSFRDIKDCLLSVGIRHGDKLFVHSNIGFFGRIDGALSQDEYCEMFLNAVMDVIGPQGCLVVPSFTYSFCRGNDFDPLQTPSEMGAFAEYVRTRQGAYRSCDANFSISALGDLAEDLTRDMPEHSFGPNSFSQRLIDVGAKILNMNFDAGSTIVHYIEKKMLVPYRYDKAFIGNILLNDSWTRQTNIHFVRHLDDPSLNTDMTRVHAIIKNSGILKAGTLGRGMMIAIDTAAYERVLCDQLHRDPFVLTPRGASI